MRVANLAIALLIFLVACKKNELGFEEVHPIKLEPFGKAYVSFSYEGFDQLDSAYESIMFFTLIPRDLQKTEVFRIAARGANMRTIEVDRRAMGEFWAFGGYSQVMLEPGDTTYVRYEKRDNTIDVEFDGLHAEVNRFLYKRAVSRPYTDLRKPFNMVATSDLNYDQFKNKIDSVVNEELAYFNSSTSFGEKIPKWFQEYYVNYIKQSGKSFLGSYPLFVQQFEVNDFKLPEDYYSYIEPEELNQMQYDWSYLNMLDSYFIRDAYDSLKHLSGYRRISAFWEQKMQRAMQELGASVLPTYQAYLFAGLLPYFKTTESIDSLANAYGIDEYDKYMHLSGLKSRRDNTKPKLYEGDTIPSIYVVGMDDQLYDLKDSLSEVTYIAVWASWCKPCIQNVQNFNQMVNDYDENKKLSFLSISFDKDDKNWRQAVSNYEIRGTQLRAEGNWVDYIKDYFDFSGIPHYFILNEDGVIINTDAEKAPEVSNYLVQVAS